MRSAIGDPMNRRTAPDSEPVAHAGTGEPIRAVPCIACDSTTPPEVLYVKNGCPVVRCRDCGLGSADAQDFDPGAYYTGSYFDGGHSDGYADYAGSEPILRREFHRLVQKIAPLVPRGSRLLEIGCAYGFFLLEAREHFEVHGIELATDAVEACHRAGLAEVRRGVADAAAIGQLAPLGAAVMLDVIEHLPAPADTLALCAQALKPGGVIVLTTGDFGSALARLSGRSWRLMTPPQHLFFFTPRSMHHLAARLGLEVVSIDHPWKVVPFSLMLFQATRMLGVRSIGASGSPASRSGLPVNLFDAMRVVLRRPAA